MQLVVRPLVNEDDGSATDAFNQVIPGPYGVRLSQTNRRPSRLNEPALIALRRAQRTVVSACLFTEATSARRRLCLAGADAVKHVRHPLLSYPISYLSQANGPLRRFREGSWWSFRYWQCKHAPVFVVFLVRTWSRVVTSLFEFQPTH